MKNTILRTLQRSDQPQLVAIEQTVHVAPWSNDTFRTCFDSGYVGWVIECDKKIIGFIMVSMRAEECHILNLVVAHEYQRLGHGRRLLEKALATAKSLGVGIAYLEVRRSNSRAIDLYQKFSFQQIGERKNYYPTVVGNEDALVFARSLR